MKTNILISGLFLIAICLVSCNDDVDPDPDPIPAPSQLESVQFTSQALANSAIGNPTLRDMMVYIPEGYDPNGEQEYPVVYLLHGLPFSDSTYISIDKWDPWIDPNGVFKTYPDFPEEGFRNWIDNLIETERIDPLIIVMPDAENEMYGFCFYTNSILNGNFEDYIANDLVNFIDDRYKTIASSEGRAVIGHSQGGYGALKLGMKHPDVFGVIAAHSAPMVFEGFKSFIPAVLAENQGGTIEPGPGKFLTNSFFAFSSAWSPNLNNPPFMVDLPFEFPSGEIVESTWNRWLEHDPLTMLGTYGMNFSSLNGIYFDAGLSDVFGFWQASDIFTQVLDAQGITHTYQTYDGDHFDQMFSRLEASLEFCSEKMN